MYQKVMGSNSVKRLSDGAFVPSDTDNKDWGEYMQWCDNGNTPLPQQELSIAEQKAMLSKQRDEDLNLMTYDSGGGVGIQCRPIDRQNLQDGINLGLTEWKAGDNSVYAVTVETLQAALDYGRARGLEIWLEHLDAVKILDGERV